jgi:hypothetical protein
VSTQHAGHEHARLKQPALTYYTTHVTAPKWIQEESLLHGHLGISL